MIGNIQSAQSDPQLKGLCNSSRLQGAQRCPDSKKQLTKGKVWPAFFEVANEYISGGIGKWKNQFLSRLALRNPYGAGTPVDVIEGE
jgi:hypothetical protein